MADDPYSILGVRRTATAEEITRAFRKLAKELHPDVNPGKGAEEKFKRVASAHDLLSDPERRRAYDRGEIDANGEPMHGYGRGGYAGAGAGGRGYSDFPFADVFSDMFSDRGAGSARGRRGPDVRYTLDVEFLEAVNGTKKRVTLPDGGVLDLNVPEGVTDGQVLRLRGKGGAGVERGDALVEIKVKPHPAFKREGDDILSEVPVTIDEAVLGAKIEVPTAASRIALTIPKGTSSGKTFRLKGKGVRNPQTGTVGDHLVTVRIVLPPVIDDTLAYFLSEWRQKNAYDPGRG